MHKTYTLALDGALTIDCAVDLRQRLVDAIANTDALRVELGNVTELDSACVQLLMAAKRSAELTGKPFELVDHSSEVLAVFALLNLANYFGDPVRMPSA